MTDRESLALIIRNLDESLVPVVLKVVQSLDFTHTHFKNLEAEAEEMNKSRSWQEEEYQQQMDEACAEYMAKVRTLVPSACLSVRDHGWVIVDVNDRVLSGTRGFELKVNAWLCAYHRLNTLANFAHCRIRQVSNGWVVEYIPRGERHHCQLVTAISEFEAWRLAAEKIKEAT